MWTTTFQPPQLLAAQSSQPDQLSVALLEALGEQGYAELRVNAGRLCRGELGVSAFDELVRPTLDRAMYRSLILTIPDESKRAELLKRLSAPQATSWANQASAAAAEPTGEPRPTTPPAAAPPARTEESESEGGEPDSPPSPSAALEASKAAVLAKERAIASTLAERQAALLEETAKLASVQAQLDMLAVEQGRSIGHARNRLEELNRELAWIERDYNQKEAAYIAAKNRFEKKREAKKLLVEHLTVLTLNVEKKKEEKLNEIMLSINGR